MYCRICSGIVLSSQAVARTTGKGKTKAAHPRYYYIYDFMVRSNRQPHCSIRPRHRNRVRAPLTQCEESLFPEIGNSLTRRLQELLLLGLADSIGTRDSQSSMTMKKQFHEKGKTNIYSRTHFELFF